VVCKCKHCGFEEDAAIWKSQDGQHFTRHKDSSFQLGFEDILWHLFGGIKVMNTHNLRMRVIHDPYSSSDRRSTYRALSLWNMASNTVTEEFTADAMRLSLNSVATGNNAASASTRKRTRESDWDGLVSNTKDQKAITSPAAEARISDIAVAAVSAAGSFCGGNDSNGVNSAPPSSAAAQPNAVKRLSKWAARLFDPDRPKGLVQAPQTIPLSDEFLQAFGRREKETNRVLALEINHSIDDNDSDDEIDGNVNVMTNESSLGGSASGLKNRKVKITNLKYTTTAATLEAACAAFGPVEFTKLVMQTDSSEKNSGIAYVTFTTASSAEACREGLTSIDQRPVNVTTAALVPTSSNNSRSKLSTAASNAASRYYGNARLLDLSTKCFQCGQIGHMASACTNAALIKPCQLCAKTDHEMRNCPDRQVCFNCGIPGHVSRSCSVPRGRPERRFCTVCYKSFDHSRGDCRYYQYGSRKAGTIPPPDTAFAVCVTCGNTGHYLCRKLQWQSNLEGVTCSKWYGSDLLRLESC
jgi:cellular nucleic acid-binding protein